MSDAPALHAESHRTHRVGWLRAAVLGANDGLISTSSLIVGVAAASAARGAVLTAAVAGLAAGTMSMAAGEYVSVGSQLDTERADLELEKRALAANEPGEREELTEIYQGRGLTRDLAEQVAAQLMAHDALGAHARDEIGLSDVLSARPLQAAMASAISFAIGALVPVLLAAVAPRRLVTPLVVAFTIVMLAVLGGVAARTGGASTIKGAIRVALWGGLAMAITAGVGKLFHVAA
jgi:VIT1/CCC1 family predicted Fe2+/Mn2+ transporter